MLLVKDFVKLFHVSFEKVCYEMVHWEDIPDFNYPNLEQQCCILKKSIADLLCCLLLPIPESYLLKAGLSLSEYKKVILLVWNDDEDCHDIEVCDFNRWNIFEVDLQPNSFFRLQKK